MKRYKLTTQDLTTYKGFPWEVFEWVKATGAARGLCSDAYLHCYDSLEVAALMNPIHANFNNPRAWIVETRGRSLNDNGLKRGYKEMRLIREVEPIALTTEQRVKIAILITLEVCVAKNFITWAKDWLSGKDRSKAAARAARAAARVMVAADAAGRAAEAAADADWEAAADWAAEAAFAAKAEAKHIDIQSIVREAIK